VTFLPSLHCNRLHVEVAGQNIFSCRLTALKYNSDGSDDPICYQVIDVIMEAIQRIIPSLYDYHKVLKLHNAALREEYLENLSLYQRSLIEGLLQDVVDSANLFCQNIVKKIIQDAVNFKLNLCQQLTEDVLASALQKIEATEGCAQLVEDAVDNIVVELETARALAVEQDIQNVIEDVIETSYYSTVEGKMSVCQDIVETAAEEAFSSTADYKTELARSAIEDALDEAYPMTKDGTADFCRDMSQALVENALSNI
jgi:hypothetical protein